MVSLQEIQTSIAAACQKAGRSVDDITLIAVSKFQSLEKIMTLSQQGQRHFGENRVQEGMEKFPALRHTYPDLQLHMLGHLQTNKARDAVKYFDVIHSLDSIKLTAALAEQMQKQGRSLSCFIQVNTGDEAQKGGISMSELEALYRFCHDEAKIDVMGLMCIPPANLDPAPHFLLLKKLAKVYQLKNLSMGMSADYTTAIKCGATHIRIGTALFGER